MDLKSIPDDVLLRRLDELAAEGRRNLRAFLEHLREFEARRLAAATRHASTFAYCTRQLRLSEGEAFRRMQVAGLIDRFPTVLDMIEAGALTLTTASLLAPHLNKANFEELTAKASHLPRREVEFLVAAQAPRRLPADVTRLVRLGDEPGPSGSPLREGPEEPLSSPTWTPPPVAAAQPMRVEPLSGQAARIHFTATRELLDNIERARMLLRHKYPSAEYSDIFREALDALLDRKDPDLKETAARKRPVLPDRRRIPQWVRDEVWKRDSGRCAFIAADGERCGQTAWLEFDHVQPFALGGRSDDPANVRLLCRAHNQHASRRAFGR